MHTVGQFTKLCKKTHWEGSPYGLEQRKKERESSCLVLAGTFPFKDFPASHTPCLCCQPMQEGSGFFSPTPFPIAAVFWSWWRSGWLALFRSTPLVLLCRIYNRNGIQLFTVLAIIKLLYLLNKMYLYLLNNAMVTFKYLLKHLKCAKALQMSVMGTHLQPWILFLLFLEFSAPGSFYHAYSVISMHFILIHMYVSLNMHCGPMGSG